MKDETKGGKAILIVDDEPHIRALLEETLEEFTEKGVCILVAENGSDGLELALAHQHNLMLLDVMMPKMNGYDVCENIKKKYNLKHIYIIMLTAKGQEVDKKQGCEAGADEFMTKPFDPDEIIKRASEILEIEL
ncbi:MAG: response regulator [Elusimicrobia bacterium]|nr:response regulator [Elusimicrobiota bacterium]